MIHETLRSYALTLDYLDTLLVGVSNDQMTMQAPGVVNHPAWTIGHLIYSAQLLAGELGKSPWLPADWEWERKFGTGSTPQATGYPPKKDLLALMTDAQYRLSERLHQMNPEDLEVPLPDERHRNTFPTLADAVLHILVAHTASHVGQLIVWRRAVGLGPIAKEFL